MLEESNGLQSSFSQMSILGHVCLCRGPNVPNKKNISFVLLNWKGNSNILPPTAPPLPIMADQCQLLSSGGWVPWAKKHTALPDVCYVSGAV